MAHLIVKTGEGEPVIHELKGTAVTIGRLADNDIVLDHPTVSRDHAEIIGRNKSYHLRDLNSSDGTTVNGQPVKEIDLKDGDVVRFAGVESTFRVVAGTVDAAKLFRPLLEEAHAMPVVRPAPAVETRQAEAKDQRAAPTEEADAHGRAFSLRSAAPVAICLLGTFLFGIGVAYLCEWTLPGPTSGLTARLESTNRKLQAEIDSIRTDAAKVKGLQAQIDSLSSEAAKAKALQNQIDSLKVEAARVKGLEQQVGTLKVETAKVKVLQDQIGQLGSQLAALKSAAAASSTNVETHPATESGTAETPGIQSTTEKEIETSGRDLTGHRLQMACTFRRVDNLVVETFLGNAPDYVGLSAHDKNGGLVQYIYASKAKYGNDLLKLKYGDKIRIIGFVKYLGGPGGVYGFSADQILW